MIVLSALAVVMTLCAASLPGVVNRRAAVAVPAA
jgi:hypothetical protein